ncbi:hypothetical protein NIG5292_02810 [Nereida ignava]|uniref:Invasion protein B, involved in pathogenesis n=2 Tax=Nereida ignava TaxID=282199 RepID=A0A0U1NQM0_9RHOB|nr:hypothetical protein [Nereida ignava]CRK76743.1 hypothetical protein NIG5292_02810 [Nereida ignava]SFJ94152.1 hypothetical protein SAMN02745667_02835 [Nereida ignava DSM 16309]
MPIMPKRTGYKTITLICAFLALPVGVHAEEEIDADAWFGDWSVFIDSGDCWLASHPIDMSQQAIEDVTLFVAFHQRSMNSEISVLFECGLVDVSDVEVTLDSKAYSLNVYEDTAFTSASENTEILKKMLLAKQTSISFSTLAETFNDLAIGYGGFRDAYNFTNEHCGFFKNNDLDGDQKREPI